MLVDLSWKHPPGLDEVSFLGFPHWLCPVILSPKGKAQPYLWLLAPALDNVIVYGTFGDDEQLWHPSTFGLSACVYPPYMLLKGIPSTQENGGHLKTTRTDCILPDCVSSSSASVSFPCFGRRPLLWLLGAFMICDTTASGSY